MEKVEQDLVERYIRDLSGPDWENAWHSILELGPIVLPRARRAYHSTQDPAVRRLLIRIFAELRDAEALEVLGEALRDPNKQTWKAALDAIVSIGDANAVDLLACAEQEIQGEQRQWIKEALGQMSPPNPGGS